MYIRLFYF
jgi:hypothetical protein